MKITVNSANAGLVLATNRSLNSIEFVSPPTRFGNGLFRLVDRHASGFERQLHCENFDYSWSSPRNNSSMITSPYPLLAGGNIKCTNLVATAVPPGASFELMVS
jgi:hypothetical protein